MDYLLSISWCWNIPWCLILQTKNIFFPVYIAKQQHFFTNLYLAICWQRRSDISDTNQRRWCIVIAAVIIFIWNGKHWSTEKMVCWQKVLCVANSWPKFLKPADKCEPKSKVSNYWHLLLRFIKGNVISPIIARIIGW